MRKKSEVRYRLDRQTVPSVRNWKKPSPPEAERMAADVAVDMGWGRLIFGQTFQDPCALAHAIRAEEDQRRDIAYYIRDPHVVLSIAPDQLFLDPSHSYRCWTHDYRPDHRPSAAFHTRRLVSIEDAQAVNRIYAARGMVTCDPTFMTDRHASRLRTYFVAETEDDEKRIIGTVTGVDHVEAFNDIEAGSSLWCLAVDPQATVPGVGEALVRHLLEHYFTRGRAYVDLSVMHDNTEAIRLYEKLGFQRVPIFCIKRKNPINEPLYTPPLPESELNIYAGIIVKEARRRGIGVEVIDAEYGYFALHQGGRKIVCRESLSELTSAVAMSRCDDKRVTHRVLRSHGLRVPTQHVNALPPGVDEGRWVVKPARGEQGVGIRVDLRGREEVAAAMEIARQECQDVLVETYVEGRDLRLIVIDFKVVAAAVRKPPRIAGDGTHSLAELIEKYNRRRAAATGGESRVPVDDETRRCLALAGYGIDTVLPLGEEVDVRKTANLHTGGTIHDVTAELHPDLRAAAEAGARALNIPVVGFDFMVPDVSSPDYVVIEANERPGLANHEPQPTAERFIDLLFPQTATSPPAACEA